MQSRNDDVAKTDDVGSPADAYRRSLEDPEGFWLEAAQAVKWIKRPKQAFDIQSPSQSRWFPGATLNTCYNALDRHVIDGRGDDVALIHDSAANGQPRSWTYAELLEQVAQAAGVLQALGVAAGDRVVIYMPTIPEAVVSMLACARIGAAHCVAAGGVDVAELAALIDDARPKVVLTASWGAESNGAVEFKTNLDAALAKAQWDVVACVVVQRPEVGVQLHDRDFDWAQVMKPGAVQPVGCVAVKATDPLYLLYTSGTEAFPQGIVRDNGGHAVALTWSMQNIYGMQAGDVWFSTSELDSLVGHSAVVYGPLFAGLTTVLRDSEPVETPDADALWRLVEKYAVNGMLTEPTALQALKQQGSDTELLAGKNIASLRHIFLAGERLDAGTCAWASATLGVPVSEAAWHPKMGCSLIGDDGSFDATWHLATTGGCRRRTLQVRATTEL